MINPTGSLLKHLMKSDVSLCEYKKTFTLEKRYFPVTVDRKLSLDTLH